jgi:S1-C subfamily serine protease
MTEVLRNLSDDLATTVETAGSGVVVVTAHHVVERDENINVGTAGGETVAATLVGRDPTTDLAVLRVEGADLAPPTWAEPDGLSVGHLVLGLGRPGRTVQATLGIVSALGEGWRTPAGGRVEPYLQTDLVMYPGFSGGPLVDVAGGVLGLNTSALLRGISLSVPTPTVRQVVETLLAHGRVRRGYLGVGAQPVRLPADLAEGVGQETGLLLVSVEPGAPADGAGLTLGDTIVALDGQPVRHMDELLALLGGDRVGASVPVGIVRGGQTQEMTVTIGERP